MHLDRSAGSPIKSNQSTSTHHLHFNVAQYFHSTSLPNETQSSLPDVMAEEYKAQLHKYTFDPFMRRRQLRKLLFLALTRWLLTASVIGALYGVLVHYSSKEVMIRGKKRTFNAVMTALSITLSLNLASSLKAMAGDMRWWILSLRDWSLLEADLILQSDYISHMFKLACETRLWSVRTVILLWILVNLAAQVAVATLGLTYAVDTAETVTITHPGIVAIPSLEGIETYKVVAKKSQSLSALRFTANNYGQVALAFDSGRLSAMPKPNTLWNPDGPLVYCDRDSCEYVFFEGTPEQEHHYLAVATNRTVRTNATCNASRVTRGGDGNEPSITLDNGTTVSIPARNGESQTTFMTDNNQNLSQPMGHITAFEASDDDPWFYECTVTVGPVSNVQIPAHELGINVSALAASAIALQGYGASPYGSSVNSTSQFQSYPAESTYGFPQKGDTTGMSLLLASFSAGVIGVTAQANDDILAPGLRPLRGVTLHVANWTYVHTILCLVAGVHLFLAIVSALLADRVAVQSHSMLAMVELLRPASQKLGYRCLGPHGNGMLQGGSPTLKYRQSGNGAYSFHTNCAFVDHS